MTTNAYDAIIVGASVAGLAVARRLRGRTQPGLGLPPEPDRLAAGICSWHNLASSSAGPPK
jgi:hypothetical protein